MPCEKSRHKATTWLATSQARHMRAASRHQTQAVCTGIRHPLTPLAYLGLGSNLRGRCARSHQRRGQQLAAAACLLLVLRAKEVVQTSPFSPIIKIWRAPGRLTISGNQSLCYSQADAGQTGPKSAAFCPSVREIVRDTLTTGTVVATIDVARLHCLSRHTLPYHRRVVAHSMTTCNMELGEQCLLVQPTLESWSK